MARPLRLEFAVALNHVTARGDRREDIYLDDEDRSAFLEVISEVCQRFNWTVHAYCLMTNHYHLVVETPDANLSKGMRQLNGVYTQRFNRRHRRVGHVFQGRYHGVLVQKERYLLEFRDPNRLQQLSEIYPRQEAMARAYLSGAYTMKEIADFFAVHYMTVSRAVRMHENGILECET